MSDSLPSAQERSDFFRTIDTLILSKAVRTLMSGETDDDVSAAVYDELILAHQMGQGMEHSVDEESPAHLPNPASDAGEWALRQAKSTMSRARACAANLIRIHGASIQPPPSSNDKKKDG